MVEMSEHLSYFNDLLVCVCGWVGEWVLVVGDRGLGGWRGYSPPKCRSDS